MARPERIRIEHNPDPGGRFHYIGRMPDGGQFMAFATGALEYDPISGSQRWDGLKKWMAVVHHFAADGRHLTTTTRLGGYDEEGRLVAGGKAWNELGALLADLQQGGVAEDIWVAPFEVIQDGILYGLIYETYEDDGEQNEFVMLEPNDVMFHPPWDSGKFST